MASRTRKFFLNAVSLTATALLMRGVGVAFNVYVSNKAGAEVMGLYSLLFGVYGLFITLAAAGVNLGTTRLVADALGRDDKPLALLSVKKALFYCVTTSGVATVLLYSMSGFIGEVLLGDVRTVTSLKILALTLVPIAVCACLSGYFMAVRRVKITAGSQVGIQFLKIIITAFLIQLLLPRGIEYACIALVLGGAIAEMVSLVVVFTLYIIDRKKHFKVKAQTDTKALQLSNDKKENTTKKLLHITLPVTFSSCIRSGLTTVQHILIPRGLKASGASWSTALASYGILHSMVLPIVLFPSAIISSFAGLLIPEVTECCVQKNEKRLRRITYRILTWSLVFSIGVSGIMIFFSNDLGGVIYGSEEAALYIRILAPLVPIMYIDSAVDAILKGMGYQVYSMNVNIIDALTSCILVVLLIPSMGLYGYIIAIYATETLNTALSLVKLMKSTKVKFKIFHQIIMPIVCVVASTYCAKFILENTHRVFSGVVGLVLHISLAVFIYVVVLMLTRTIGKEEKEVINASLMSTKKYRDRFIDSMEN